MPNYRRAFHPGGTFFLTLVTHTRTAILTQPLARRCLRESIALAARDRPFNLLASVLLPDHFHIVLALPADDPDFSTRIASIKARFTHAWLAAGGDEQPQTSSRERQQYRGVWQKRFWEHHIQDEKDLYRCFDYIHYNPVKHRLTSCPHAWQWTTFHRLVREEQYDVDWCCACNRSTTPKIPADIPGAEMD